MISLAELAILLASGVVAVSLFKKLGLGSVLGYLAAGVVIGPYGLKLIVGVESIMHVSEFGVVLLLFIIGLELEPSRLWVLRKHVFGYGGAQIAITTIVLSAIARAYGLPVSTAITVGFALSLSSTAFVLQILTERGEHLHVYGRTSFGILLFQDIAVIPFLAILPLLNGSATIQMDSALLLDFGKVVLAFLIVAFVGGFLIRPIFRIVAATKVKEVFTAAALLTVLGTALFMESVGLSLSLGAFLAGILLATSEYRHEFQADIEPFEGLLLGLFFISVGMSAKLNVLLERPVQVAMAVIFLILVKAIVLAMIGIRARLSKDAVVRLALALPQGGEFAFVLFTVAVGNHILDPALADFLVMVVTLSMVLTPLLFKCADIIAKKLVKKAEEKQFDKIEETANPVIIAGFGRIGQIVARILRMRKIQFTALDINQEQVDFVRKFGSKIYYGDASRLELLRAAYADQAKVFVLAIDDMTTSLKTVELVKRYFPHLKIVARARNRQHVYRLMDLGVDSIIRETFGSSIEMGDLVLKALGFSNKDTEASLTTFREHDEKALIGSYALYNDEQQLVEAAKHYAKELESIFEQDSSRESRSNQ